MGLEQHQDQGQVGINMNRVYLDVSHLAAPEPMTKIVEALSHLTFGQYLKVKHRRQPFPLFSILKENDWECLDEVHGNEHISLFIFHKNDIGLFDY